MYRVLFGVAIVRMKVLAHKVAKLFAVLGAAVVLPFFGVFIFAIPFTWLGYLQWSGKVEPIGNPNA